MAYCRRYLRIQNIDKTSSKAKESIKEKSFAGYFTIDRNYLKECPKPKKMPIFSYKQE